MKISVIVPVYNAQKYLNACVNSVIGQTYTNWELILVDDGSVDQSSIICDGYSKKFPKQIKVLHQINSGQIISRVAGMKHASGEYFVFLDADDLLCPDALEKIAASVRTYDADMLIYNGHYMSEDGEKGDLIYSHYNDSPTCYAGTEKKMILSEVILGRRFNYIWMKAFKRSCVNLDIDYRPYSYIRTEEDLFMQLPYFEQAENICYIPESLYLYRDSIGSVTKKFHPQMYKSVVQINKALRYYGETWDVEGWEQICRHRFMQDVISVIKQMSAAKGTMTKKEQTEYLKTIRRDSYLKENSEGCLKDMSIKQKIVLSLFMCRAYAVLLLLI